MHVKLTYAMMKFRTPPSVIQHSKTIYQ